jgi:signal transduction histidine kinase
MSSTIDVLPVDDAADLTEIAAEEREGIFKAGYTTKSGGTGLGLAIVGGVTEAHGWTVEVVSGTDDGAGFEIRDVTFVE